MYTGSANNDLWVFTFQRGERTPGEKNESTQLFISHLFKMVCEFDWVDENSFTSK
jgi:hypothetical protein